jgi:Tol biopolymer transport system component
MAALAAVAAVAAATLPAAGASPRGTNGLIVFDRADPASPDDQSIYTANPDGSGERLVLPHNCCGGWSADGNMLAFAYLAPDGRLGPATVRADGSGYTELPIDDPTLSLGCGGTSPDGTRLLCQGWQDDDTARNGVYTIAPDGSDLRRVTAGLDEPGGYSPDGKRIVFLRFDADGNTVGLFVVDVASGRLRRITPPGTLIQSGNDGSWSPQGNEIVFSRHVTPDVRGSIWVVHADGTGLREIRVQGLACGGRGADPNGYGCHGIHWSPDGRKLIFAANSPASGRNIYTANADGTGLVQVTHDGGDDNPGWGTHPLAP